MSRQIQIRRGTATEHENFTGAMGEVTMDTTNKTLRVHDGETAGGTPLAKQSEIPTIPPIPEFSTDYTTKEVLNWSAGTTYTAPHDCVIRIIVGWGTSGDSEIAIFKAAADATTDPTNAILWVGMKNFMTTTNEIRMNSGDSIYIYTFVTGRIDVMKYSV